ncbi:ATP-binding protein [Streptacidiphilus albus]|uniref:ATP-binding protein n=1 Tax=Streptacidiphilus albus TaxID=105425 RepID=UPI0009DF8D6F|nr:tetratricopeptide repeat protein [Streptacidiphilus albus]
MSGTPGGFAVELREQRKRAGLTQQELADAAGVSLRTVSDLERGVATTPQRETVRLLGSALSLLGVERARFETAARGRPLEVVSAAAAPPVRSLPRDVASFTGRQRELGLLTSGAVTAGGVVGIHAIGGMAGVGKTTLAVHAAHRLAADFPDGQLFIDLHGYDPQAEPVSALDALGRLLPLLGVSAHAVPAGEVERSALLRDRLAGTRTLMVVDNAADTAQVRPLLPGTSSCLVIVTSRRRLPGLDDATLIDLNALSIEDAVALLRRVAGPGRIHASEEHLAEQIADLCGRIPLALRITATRLKHRSALTLDDLAQQLRDDHHRLDALADGDRSLTATFEGSYRRLEPGLQRLFRLLGLIPGQDFDPYAAANLLQSDHRTAARMLDTLLDHNLLIQHTSGRYRFHDLVRDYARTLTTADNSEAATALGHLFDYYEHTARTLSDTPGDSFIVSDRRLDTPEPFAAPQFTARTERLAWLRTERDNITAAAARASTRGQLMRAVNLVEALSFILHADSAWADGIRLFRSAAEAVKDLDAPVMEADLLARLGRFLFLNGDYRAAATVHLKALRLYEDAGERRCQAVQLRALCWAHTNLAELPAATGFGTRALEILREVDDLPGQASALLALALASEGVNLSASIAHLKESLTIHESLGRHSWKVPTLNLLAAAETTMGRFPEALAHLEQALPLARSIDSLRLEGMVLRNWAHCSLAVGDQHGAADLAEASLASFLRYGDEIGAAHGRLTVGVVRQAAGRHAEAIEIIEAGLAAFRKAERPESIGEAVIALARSHRCLGHTTAAEELCREALGLHERSGLHSGHALALVEAGALAAQTGSHDQALAYYAQALEITRRLGTLPCTAAALAGQADCLWSQGRRAAALDALREAVGIYQRIGAGAAPEAAARLAAREREHAAQ